MSFVKSLLLIAFAEALIFAGVCFLSGQLLPTLLADVHRLWPTWLKLLVFSLIVSIPANLMISWGFRETGATYSGVVYAIFAVIGAVVTAVLVDGASIKLNSLVAFAIMILSAAWGIIALRSTIP